MGAAERWVAGAGVNWRAGGGGEGLMAAEAVAHPCAWTSLSAGCGGYVTAPVVGVARVCFPARAAIPGVACKAAALMVVVEVARALLRAAAVGRAARVGWGVLNVKDNMKV